MWRRKLCIEKLLRRFTLSIYLLVDICHNRSGTAVLFRKSPNNLNYFFLIYHNVPCVGCHLQIFSFKLLLFFLKAVAWILKLFPRACFFHLFFNTPPAVNQAEACHTSRHFLSHWRTFLCLVFSWINLKTLRRDNRHANRACGVVLKVSSVLRKANWLFKIVVQTKKWLFIFFALHLNWIELMFDFLYVWNSAMHGEPGLWTLKKILKLFLYVWLWYKHK